MASAVVTAGAAPRRHAIDASALERLADAGVLHALVDACDAPEVPARVLARGPGGGSCLYHEPDASTFRDRAPYLVRVDRELLAWLSAPAAEGGLAGTPWGVFTVGDASFAEQLRHWRSWLTVASPVGAGADADGSDAREIWTFRFYDPRLVPVFLGACTPDEVAAFFGPVPSLVLPGGDDDAGGWMLTRDPSLMHRAPRRAVGERFQMRDAHVGAFQRRSFGDTLIASVERESATLGQRAWRDPRDPEAGDVLVSGAGAASAAAGTDDRTPLRIGLDERGFVGTVTSPLGRRWVVTSNRLGRPLQLTMPSGARIRLTYDAQGQVARVARGVGSAEQLVYGAEHDAAGRLTRATYADGTTHGVRFDAPVGFDTRTGYDPGFLDPRGEYPSAVTDRLGRTTQYTYDADRCLTSIVDPLGRVTRYTYGRWSRPDAVSYPDGRRERYAYDVDGRVAAITLADGVALRVRTDDAGATVAIVSDGLSGIGRPAVAGVDVAYERDEAGRVRAATTAARPAVGAIAAIGTTSTARFTYDDAGRVLSDVVTVGGAEGDAPHRTSVGYAYDAQGTLVALTYPSGERVGFERDADGRLTGVTDWAGERYAIAHAPNDAGWTLTTPAGLVVATRQNAVGLPVETTLTDADARELFAVSVGYDAEDRVTGVDDTRLGRWRYARDAEGQIVACDGPTVAEGARYAYDAAGNRVEVREGDAVRRDDAPLAVEVDAGDRLLRQGALRLTYDAAGRTIARDDDAGLGPAGQWRYAYDARGQLVRAWGRGADGVRRAVAFAYDGFGRRVWKLALECAPRSTDVVGRRTRFVWAGEQLVREVAEEASWAAVHARHAIGREPPSLDAPIPADVVWRARETRDYLYWPGASTPLLLRVVRPNDVRTYLYHADHLGAPVRLTDAAGRVVWEAAYAPFGAARETVREVAQPWRRPGQYWDAELGLAYNRFRYYDPRLGRYLTPDPVGPLGGSHAYRYVGNAPVDDADPLGLWPSFKSIVKVVAAVAVAAVVVATAPVSLPLAIIAAGVAAGATYGLLNEGMENGFGCPSCLAGAALKGGVVGGLAALPFAFLPAAAGVAAFAGAGAGSGAIGYTADWALSGAHPNQWSWRGFAGSTAFGAVTAGAGRYVAPRVSSWWRGSSEAPVEPAPPAKDPYSRPSGFRKGVRDDVWEQNRGPEGNVRDPVSGDVMDPAEPWDMGHKPGYEFRKHQASARDRGITRKEFLDEHNDPSHYRPELPSSNRGHDGEDMTDNYFGP